MDFQSLTKSQEILRAVKDLEWEEPTPVQEQSIPIAMAGDDLMGQAQTGTGKTGAFAIPILSRLPANKRIQVLALVPTRELAMQVAEDFDDLAKYTGHNTVAIYGGQSINVQVTKIRKGVEVVVGTPGRLMDLMRRGELNFDGVSVVVLDEADRMLDMGFIDDIEWILQRVPRQRQTMLFSATLPEAIRELAQRYMRDPKSVIISQDTLTVDNAEQSYINVGRKNKLWALCRIFDTEKPPLTLVFCSTKRMVDMLVHKLRAYGYSADGIHGDLSQAAREKVMDRFKHGKVKILVATDVAARGLDIEGITHVVNYDIPENPEDYVHRIGRTARAGKTGKAITFVSKEEQYLVKQIENFGRTTIQMDDVPDGSGRDKVKRQLDLDEYADMFGMVPFRLNIGKDDGVDMLSLIKFITRKANIDEHLIGDVTVGRASSEVRLHKSVAFYAMKDLERCSIQNKYVKMDIVR